MESDFKSPSCSYQKAQLFMSKQWRNQDFAGAVRCVYIGPSDAKLWAGKPVLIICTSGTRVDPVGTKRGVAI